MGSRSCTRRLAVWLAAGLVAFGATTVSPAAALGERGPTAGSGSVDDDGIRSTPALSRDGRWVAFVSREADLLSARDKGRQHVLVADTRTGRLQVADVSGAGVPADADSADPSISADGRWVSFDSFADNLVPGIHDRVGAIYLHDMRTGTTVRVSNGLAGADPDGQSGFARISADGRWVAFNSLADNLVRGRPAGCQVYVWDRTTGVTTLLSANWWGAPGGAGSGDPAISADGRWVAFDSAAGDLVPDYTATVGTSEVYLRDRLLGTTVLVSRHTSRIGDDLSSRPSISDDGRLVAFESRATNLLPPNPTGQPAQLDGPPSAGGDPRVFYHVYVADLVALRTSEADVSAQGSPARGDSYAPAISPDGRVVAFTSTDATLVPGALRPQRDVYLRDRATGTTTRLSSAADGAQAPGASWSAALDQDAGLVAFVSEAPLAGTADPTGAVYLRENRRGGRTVRVA